MDKNFIQQKILNDLKYPVHGLLNIFARVGKTKLCLDIIKRENCNSVLWVTPNTKLRDYSLPAEIEKWKYTDLKNKIKFVCYSSLHKEKGFYDKIVLDEYQYCTENNLQNILNKDLKYNTIIGLSATHPKHEEKKELFKELNLNIIYKFDVEKAVNNNIIKDYEIKVILIETNDIKKWIYVGEKKVYMSERDIHNGNNVKINNLKKFGKVPKWLYIKRMQDIYNSQSKIEVAKEIFSNLKGRTIIFAPNIEKSKLFGNCYNSKTDDTNLNDFVNNEINFLTCVNTGGIGYTFENVDNVLIIQANRNNRGDITQKIARGLIKNKNKKTKIYILCLKNTIDEQWVISVIKNFNKNKIKILNYDDNLAKKL